MGSYICQALVSPIIITCLKSASVPTSSLGNFVCTLELVLYGIQAQLSRTDWG